MQKLSKQATHSIDCSTLFVFHLESLISNSNPITMKMLHLQWLLLLVLHASERKAIIRIELGYLVTEVPSPAKQKADNLIVIQHEIEKAPFESETLLFSSLYPFQSLVKTLSLLLHLHSIAIAISISSIVFKSIFAPFARHAFFLTLLKLRPIFRVRFCSSSMKYNERIKQQSDYRDIDTKTLIINSIKTNKSDII